MRKRWTPQLEVTESLSRLRNKRKWQIALRRYVLEENSSSFYAPYFGLDSRLFREWIERQFDEGMSWDNFSVNWQLDHVVPVSYFDLDQEPERQLCWNFINIRAEKPSFAKSRSGAVDILAAKRYFEVLHQQINYPPCARMIAKIEQLERMEAGSLPAQGAFLLQHQDFIRSLEDLTAAEFERLNKGASLGEIQEERAFIQKYS
jgi:hypothetical protein